jgi:hypothetical protein
MTANGKSSTMDFNAMSRDGIVLTHNVPGHVEAPRSLTRAVESGELVKLRRGAYVPAGIWERSDYRARHILRIRAVVAHAAHPIVLCGESAAALWGMPISGAWPTSVSVLDNWRGGGRAEPGIRRTTAGFATSRVVELDEFRVTDVTRTALDVARRVSFSEAVGSLDWAISRTNPRAVSLESLADDAENFDARLGRRHLQRVVGFATSLSDSFGESRCRAVIHLQGFQPPELQVEFRDELGSMYPDFYWRTARVAAEFDGKQKYTRDEYTHGDPVEVLWREKNREDRLRKQISGLARLLTSDVEHPERLSRKLTDAGVPRGGRT